MFIIGNGISTFLLIFVIYMQDQFACAQQTSYYGKEIGEFVGGNNGGATAHGVQGTVYAIDDHRIWVVGFSYDGLGPDAFVWAGNSSQPDYSGDIIPLEYGGSEEVLGAYNNENLVIKFPRGKRVSDYKWISIWCREFSANFAQVLIPDGFVAPSEYLLTTTDGGGNEVPLELGFTPRVHQVHADRVYIIDTRRIQLEHLDYDGNAPKANYWIGTGTTPNRDGWAAWDENWSDQYLPYDATQAFNQKTVIVTLPPQYTVHDIGYLSLWCIAFTQDFGHVIIPDLTDANIPPYVEDQGPYYGKELGWLVGGPNNAPTSYDVGGQVFAVDTDTLLIRGFSYNGQAPATYLWVGTSDMPSGDGQIVIADYSNPILRAYNTEDVIAKLPKGTTFSDYKWISVWCEEAGVSFGHVSIPSGFTAPAEHDLSQLFGFYPPVHGVSADGVYVIDHKTIRIENLNYDGNGPDAYYWTGPGWSPDTNGWIALDSQNGDMMLPNDGIGYTDKTVIISMPEGYTVFDVGHIGLWCRLARQDFGHIKIPPRSQLNVPPLIEKPKYYGALIGEFKNTVHGVTGTVYAIDNSRLWLIGFSYDGLGPDAYLYVGTTSAPGSDGEIIPIELARKDILTSYSNEDIVVRFPKGKYITDYKWISVWCRQAVTSFAHVLIPSDFQPPSEVSVGQLGFPFPVHRVQGNAYVIDTQRIRLENLYYDGLGPDAYYWYGPEDTPTRAGLIPLDENWSLQMLPSNGVGFTNKTAVITIPEPTTVFDIGYLGLWCELFSQNFGHITMPPGHQLTVPPYVEDQGAYYGADLGAFSGDGAGSATTHGVDGTVFAIDDTRLQIIGFSYDGLGPDAYLYVGTSDEPSADGTIVPVKGSLEKLPAFDNEDLVVSLPEGTSINDFKWISVWCKQAVANFGHVFIPSGFQPPAEHNLNQQLGYSPKFHNVDADAVIIVDDKTIRIENLNYDGNAPDTYYWFGPGYTPDDNGIIAEDSVDGTSALGTGFTDKTVTITLPDGYTVFDIGHIGLWCQRFSEDFGHVKVPPRSQLNIPPHVKYEEYVVEENYYGNLIGDFIGSAHDVAGKVYAIDESRLWFVGFNYDGLGPDAFIWAGSTDSPDDSGDIIPTEYPRKEILGAYTDSDFVVQLPKGKRITDYKWISIWCRMFGVNFGHVDIPDDFVAPSEFRIAGDLGYTPRKNNIHADAVYIIDTKRLRIENLDFDGIAMDTHYWTGVGTMVDENGWPALDENWSPQAFPAVPFTGKTVIVTIPGEDTVFDIGYLGLWNTDTMEDLGHVLIPDLKAMRTAVPPYVEETGPYYGADLGAFSGDGAGSATTHGVDGTVFAIDDTRVQIIGFSYDGLGPDAYIYVGSTPEPSADGMIATVDGSLEKLGAYDNADIMVTLPEGTSMNDFKWISVWCKQAVVNFGHVVIPDTFQPPSEHNLGQMLGFTKPIHGVTADAVYVVDSKTLRIENLNYDGLGPDTYYWGGKGMPDANGFALLDEYLRAEKITSELVSKTVTVTLPEDKTVFDIDYLSLWCYQASADFGHVTIPPRSHLNVPPHIPIVEEPYYGKELGMFSLDGSPATHGVTGNVYAMDDTKLWITGFNYDGLGPDAYLWVGTTDNPGQEGYIVPVDGSSEKLVEYIDAELVVTLPDGMKLNHFKWLSVWCKVATANFGHVRIPADFAAPSIHTIQQPLGYEPLVHQVQADSVEILDTRRLKISNLAYDGQGPDTYYWAGKGATPDTNGFIVSPEDGSSPMLPNDGMSVTYDTVILLLPDGITVFDIDYIGLWCQQASVSFGHVLIPEKQDLDIPPYYYTPEEPYYGKELGMFSLDGSPATHGVTGTVYAMDDTRLWITGFNYDGLGPDAYLWVGTTDNPGQEGYIVPVDGSSEKLVEYIDAELVVTLPDGMKLNHFKWLSVWCKVATANFGHVRIPADFAAPSIHTIQQPLGYEPLVHQVQADSVEILDTRRFKISNLAYDGQGPDTYYWAGKGATPDANGFIVSPADGSSPMLPNDGMSVTYDTVILLLPYGITVFDIDYIGLWCQQASSSFGHVLIPEKQDLDIPPYYYVPTPEDGFFDNCEVLLENMFHVSWTIENDATIAVELKGKVRPGTYLGFGISGSDTSTLMIGADVAIGWIDTDTNMGMVEDYYLSQYGQCVVTSGTGACPDTVSMNPTGNNNVELIQSSFDNGITTIAYRRPLDTGESDADKVIRTDQPMYIAWGIGPINPAGHAAKHRQRAINPVTLDFGRQSSSCPELSMSEGMVLTPWQPANIIAGDEITTFRATMGQAGGKRGYEGITGQPGWGIAWYLNDEIIPVLTLTRGVTYTFEVLGGDNSALQSQYHPFYITDAPNGGYFQLSPAEQQEATIFAGPVEGPLCSWESSPNCSPDGYNNFNGYRDNCLTETCASGSAGILTWTPDDNTPDLVYYHCYTHRFLGWKIHIVDPPAQDNPYSNCEVLLENKLQVSWTVADEMIDIELRGLVDSSSYMAFGLSGSPYGSSMLGADVAVGWIDKDTGEGMVEDYHLTGYEQCVVTTGSGACPDTIANPSGVNDVTLISSSYENGITSIAYRRSLDTGDENGDLVIHTMGNEFIVWAIGNLNPSGLVAKHDLRTIMAPPSTECQQYTIVRGIQPLLRYASRATGTELQHTIAPGPSMPSELFYFVMGTSQQIFLIDKSSPQWMSDDNAMDSSLKLFFDT